MPFLWSPAASRSLKDNSADELLAYDLVVFIADRLPAVDSAAESRRLERFGDAPELPLRENVALALSAKASALGSLERYKEAALVCDEAAQRFGGATEDSLQEILRGITKLTDVFRILIPKPDANSA